MPCINIVQNKVLITKKNIRCSTFQHLIKNSLYLSYAWLLGIHIFILLVKNNVWRDQSQNYKIFDTHKSILYTRQRHNSHSLLLHILFTVKGSSLKLLHLTTRKTRSYVLSVMPRSPGGLFLPSRYENYGMYRNVSLIEVIMCLLAYLPVFRGKTSTYFVLFNSDMKNFGNMKKKYFSDITDCISTTERYWLKTGFEFIVYNSVVLFRIKCRCFDDLQLSFRLSDVLSTIAEDYYSSETHFGVCVYVTLKNRKTLSEWKSKIQSQGIVYPFKKTTTLENGTTTNLYWIGIWLDKPLIKKMRIWLLNMNCTGKYVGIFYCGCTD